jgi:ADP-heptose:LPS heptosyltransferase
VAEKAVFVGLPDEYRAFQQQIGMTVPYYETRTMLELAQVIAGAEAFIGNQSQALAIAIGLGKEYACEARVDLPLERNECYFSDNPRGNYF